MECKGYIRVLKRTGENGSRCPVMGQCVIGTALDCDMRINLKGVANEHCKIFVDSYGQAIIENLASQCPTLLNGTTLKFRQRRELEHEDLFTVSDRTFRWEYLPTSSLYVDKCANVTPLSNSPVKKKVSVPLAAVHHTPNSSNRIAVVTPVRRENSFQVGSKTEKLKKSSIPVNKFYRHSLQGPDLLKKRIKSRRSCAPGLVTSVSSIEKSLQTQSPAGENKSQLLEQRKSKLLDDGNLNDVDLLDSVNVMKKSSRKSVRPNTPAKGRNSILKNSPSGSRSKSKTPSRKSVRDQLQSLDLISKSPQVQNHSVVKSTRKSRKSLKSANSSIRETSSGSSIKTGITEKKLPSTPKMDSTESSTKKKSEFKSRLKTPMKRFMETPEAMQPSAKRLKLSSNTTGKKNENLPSSSGTSSASKQVRRPLFSEMVKKKASVLQKRTYVIQNARKPVQLKVVRSKVQLSSNIPTKIKLNSTGHADSPETIIIRKKINTPRSVSRKKALKVSRSSIAKGTPRKRTNTSGGKKTPARKSTLKQEAPPSMERRTPTSKRSSQKRIESAGMSSLEVTPELRSKRQTSERASLGVSASKHTSFRENKSCSTKQTPNKEKHIIGGKQSSFTEIFPSEIKWTPLNINTPSRGKGDSLTVKLTPLKLATPQKVKRVSLKVNSLSKKKLISPRVNTPSKNKQIRASVKNLLKEKRTPLTVSSHSKEEHTPVRASSPLKNEKTPLRVSSASKSKSSPKVSSPLTKKQTPVRANSPLKNKKTPTRVSSPSKNKKTPTRVSSPLKNKKTPTRVSSPLKNKKMPTRVSSASKSKSSPKVSSPLTNKQTPVRANSPLKNKKTPLRVSSASKDKSPPKVSSPLAKKHTPVRASSPLKNEKTPLRVSSASKSKSSPKVSSPLTKKQTPVRATSPLKNKKTPTRVSSPLKNKRTPTRVSSPLKNKRTPLRVSSASKSKSSPKISSPLTKKRTPVRISSPLENKKTPLRVSSGLKGKSIPLDESPSTKGNLTPVRVSPPLKAKQTPMRLSSPLKEKQTPLRVHSASKKQTPLRVRSASVKKSTPASKKKHTPLRLKSELKGKLTPGKISSVSREEQTPATANSPSKEKQASSRQNSLVKTKRSPARKSLSKENKTPVRIISPLQEKCIAARASFSSKENQSPARVSSLLKEKQTPLRLQSTSKRTPLRGSSPLKRKQSPVKVNSTQKADTIDEVRTLRQENASPERRNSRSVGSKDLISPFKKGSVDANKCVSVMEITLYSSKRSLRGKTPVKDVSGTPAKHSPIGETKETNLLPRQSRSSKGGRISDVKVHTPLIQGSGRKDSSLLKRKLSVSEECEVSILGSGEKKRTRRNGMGSPDVFSPINSSLNLSSFKTPQVPQEIFVSPLSSRKSRVSFETNSSLSQATSPMKSVRNRDSIEFQKTPIISDVSKAVKAKDIKFVVKSPGCHSTPRNKTSRSFTNQEQILPTSISPNASMKKLHQSPNIKSPKNDLCNISGVKKQLRTPKSPISPRNDLTGRKSVRKVSSSPKNDLTVTKEVKKVLGTPKVKKSPKNNLSKVGGVKQLLRTAQVQKSPRNDLTDVRGVKRLLGTPLIQKSPRNDLMDVRGVKKLLGTPQVQKSPRNDLTNVRGVKKLFGTPQAQKSPRNDLSDVRGVKKLLGTPVVQKSPRNDLTDVRGVKKLLGTPLVQRSPRNDLTDVRGVKKLLGTPLVQKSPRNDLTDVRGVKKLLRTPVVQKSPRNDLTDVKGVKKLVRTPRVQKSPKNDLTDVSGLQVLFELNEGETQNNVTMQSDTESIPSAKRTRRIEVLQVDRITRNRRNVNASNKEESLTPHSRSKRKNVCLSPFVSESSISPSKKRRLSENQDGIVPKVKETGEILKVKEIKKEPSITPKRETKTRSTRAKKHNVKEDSQQHDTDVSPPKTRRTRNKTAEHPSPKNKSHKVIEHSSDSNSITEQERSPVKKTPIRTRRGRIQASAPEILGASKQGRGLAKVPRVTSPAGYTSVEEEKSPEPKKTSSSKRKVRTKQSSPAASPAGRETTEVNRSPISKKSPPKTRRGRVKSSAIESPAVSPVSKTEVSESSSPGSSPKKSPPKTRRGRTKLVAVEIPASNLQNKNASEITPVSGRTALKLMKEKDSPKSPIKGKRGRGKQAKSSHDVESTSQNVQSPEVKSALSPPGRKQTRSRKNEVKSVKFEDNVSSPERNRKGGRSVEDVIEDKKGEKLKATVASRVTRSRKTESADAKGGESSPRATRTSRRKKT